MHPGSQGYAYYYSFRYIANDDFVVWTFSSPPYFYSGCSPLSLYTCQPKFCDQNLGRIGSGLPPPAASPNLTSVTERLLSLQPIARSNRRKLRFALIEPCEILLLHPAVRLYTLFLIIPSEAKIGIFSSSACLPAGRAGSGIVYARRAIKI